MFRLLRYLIVLFGIAAALWLGGLMLFVMSVETMAEPEINAELQPADAVVVLTGGSERLDTGLELLEAGKGKKLFISGVHPGLKLNDLLGAQKVPKNLRNCCIVLGHAAESTTGNVEETLTWMEIEKFNSLRLVTSNYHMPRSLMLFRTAMPDRTVIPHPVSPDSVKLRGWWERPATARLLVTEYDKYLATVLRLWSGLK